MKVESGVCSKYFFIICPDNPGNNWIESVKNRLLGLEPRQPIIVSASVNFSELKDEIERAIESTREQIQTTSEKEYTLVMIGNRKSIIGRCEKICPSIATEQITNHSVVILVEDEPLIYTPLNN